MRTDLMLWKQRLNRTRALILMIMATSWLGHCEMAASAPPPPREDSTTTFPERPSSVSLPVTIRLSDISDRLNTEVPRQLFAIDENRNACVPAQWARICLIPRLFRGGCAQELNTKISPEIDCHLEGTVKRGDFRVTASGNEIIVTVPIDASVTARGRGEIGKHIQETGKGSIEARARITADISEDWQPIVRIKPDFTWTDRAHIYIDLLRLKITFASKLEPKIREVMDQLQSTINSEVKKLKVRDTAETMWKKGFEATRVSSAPDVWFRFIPHEIGLSGFTSTTNSLDVRLTAIGLTQVFVGFKPDPVNQAPLPPLRKNIADGPFDMYLPVFADYSTVSQTLESVLRINEKQSLAVPKIGDVDVVFRGIESYPAKDHAIVIRLTFEADPPGHFFDAKGSVWIKAKVKIDSSGKKLIPHSLEYGVEADNSAADFLLAIAQIDPIKSKIEKAITYDFSKQYEHALTVANEAVNQSVSKDLMLEGAIQRAGVDEVGVTADGIYMGLEVTGYLKLRALVPAK